MTDPASAKPRQLPLQVTLPEDARLEALYPTPNEWLMDWLHHEWLTGQESSLFVQAPPGGGLTHLLQAICRQSEETGQAVFYLSLKELQGHDPAVLDGMSDMALLCLDDLEAVLGEAIWDEALFHLFNRSRDLGHRIALGSHLSLPELRAVTLPDLHSRLAWGMQANWRLPEDQHWQQAIHWLARQRGLQISPDTARYLALRGPRDWVGLSALIQTLDQQALAEKRRLTQPFIREVMGW
ncbi:MAG: DnaA regulatory inactivator Hda [Natronospirillum sp.]|uniref:DnaA regulatory inactivator Hda n=1 Tax=Natronospirillum sp. TaxID=2812955 RepID=UPI0025F5A131|nr:DnaA regulatory inactivator Hda [Natronospirillum sp.]MCH8552836.1 DnaA regulatory inactivator Hda [Natronospirillum sp.]